MHPVESLAAVGFSPQDVERAREQGRLVGRGEGFVSREWRGGGGPLLAVHSDGPDAHVVCAVPFFAGLAGELWRVSAVHAGSACPHCAFAVLHAPGGTEVRAALPDFAARRGMFPQGLLAQVSLVVLVHEWRPGERAPAAALCVQEASAPGAVLAGGVVEEAAEAQNEATGARLLRCRLAGEGARVWVVGPAGPRVRAGDPLAVWGRAVARVGAPAAVRGRPIADARE